MESSTFRKLGLVLSLCTILFVTAVKAGSDSYVGRIAAIAKNVWGEDAKGVVMIIPTAGLRRDRDFIFRTQGGWVSEDARKLAALLRAAKRGTGRLSVSGLNPEKVQAVVVQGLGLNRGRSLAGVEMLVVGDDMDSRRVRLAARICRVKVHIRSFQPDRE